MKEGFRKFGDHYKVVIFSTDLGFGLPDYAEKLKRHKGFSDIWKGEVRIPLDRAIDFWKWAQGEKATSIILDVRGEFRCPSCLDGQKRMQTNWSPPKEIGKNTHEVIARCEHCGAFYRVIYTLVKKRFKKTRRYR
jgi:hypothetical protein